MTENRALPQHEITVLAETFRLLGDPTRLRILLYCLAGPRSVSVIAENLEVSQTLVSHHLRLLRGARLHKGERKSKQVFYELSNMHVSDVLLHMASHIAEEQAKE